MCSVTQVQQESVAKKAERGVFKDIFRASKVDTELWWYSEACAIF